MRILLSAVAAALVAVPAAASPVPHPTCPIAPESEGGQGAEGEEKPKPEAPPPGSLDFDLLGEAKPPPPVVEDPAQRRRRTMLRIHQGVGIGLVALQLGTTVVGQLNYLDKFGEANTGRYELTHKILAFSTAGVFAVQGLLGVLAPDPPRKPPGGFSRVRMHRYAMFTAAAAMATQVALGIWTARREGYLNQQDVGTAHLVVGYVTLAAVAVGVSAFLF